LSKSDARIISLKELERSDRNDTIKTLIEISPDTNKDFSEDYYHSGSLDCFVIDNGDEEVYGFICVEYFEDEVHINDIEIDNDCWNKGYGSKLIKYIINNVKKIIDDDIKAITLEVSNKNINAMVFYLRIGFKIVGIVSDYYSKGEHAVYMQYDI
jgi:ribosomal protein S18 acetylase RimI-like enzyme